MVLGKRSKLALSKFKEKSSRQVNLLSFASDSIWQGESQEEGNPTKELLLHCQERC